MNKIGLSVFALAVGLVAAPRAEAQSSRVIVCRTGEIAATARRGAPCAGQGGVDGRATAQARRSGTYSVNGVTRSVYGAGVNGGVANGRGVYSGGLNGGATGQRGVYSGGNNGNVYGSASQVQCGDGSWSTIGAQGCNGHSGVYGSNGRYGNVQQAPGQNQGRRHDDDGDDDGDRGNEHGRGRGHEKHEVRHDNGRGGH